MHTCVALTCPLRIDSSSMAVAWLPIGPAGHIVEHQRAVRRDTCTQVSAAAWAQDRSAKSQRGVMGCHAYSSSAKAYQESWERVQILMGSASTQRPRGRLTKKFGYSPKYALTETYLHSFV